MKKPNITEGPWRLLSNDDNWFHITAKDTTSENSLVQVLTWKHGKHPVKECNERWKADAQAISAVPKLLKEAYITYLMLLAHPEYRIEENQEFIDRVNGLHKALEKAGYEL